LSDTATTITDASVLQAIISHLLNFGARAAEDARWLVSILPDDLLGFFRSEVMKAIREKAGNDAVKTRKIFLSLGKTAKVIFGPEYAATKGKLDSASKQAVARSGRNQGEIGSLRTNA